MAGLPEILVNDAPPPPDPRVWPGWTADIPAIAPNEDGTVAYGRYAVKFQDGNPARFYPMKLLESIFDEAAVVRELELCLNNPEDKHDLAKQILTLRDAGPRYLGVFAALKEMGSPELIRGFLEHGICDRHLPLVSTWGDDDYHLFRPGDRENPIPDFIDFTRRQVFLKSQLKFAIPFFDQTQGIHEFEWDRILPYYKPERRSKSGHRVMDGPVSKVILHPLCYDFELEPCHISGPGEPMFFSLKELEHHTAQEFRDEVAMLRCSGRAHEHLVTLFAAWKQADKCFLLFPWATGNLRHYLAANHPRPGGMDPDGMGPNGEDPEMVRWVAYQTWKLVQALECVHVPSGDWRDADIRKERLGLHGNLKPENILWFAGRADHQSEGPPPPHHLARGNLVISDTGASRPHRFISGSNVRPGGPKDKTTKYWPPECDYADDAPDGARDVWSLGCIFLDLAAWLVGGHPLVRDMDRRRQAYTNIRLRAGEEYFEWVRVEEDPEAAPPGESPPPPVYYTVRLKPGVSECFAALRGRPECTRFVCDLLDVVEREMLLVERDDRIKVTPLEQKMKALYEKAKLDASYCVDAHSKSSEGYSPPKPRLVQRGFSKGVQEAVAKRPSRLQGLPTLTRGDFL
ncbi:kinase-like domain-containing protein [Xylaria palmicola]|nr:kinase-like domain-containing protein [Xylaria palmicola]